MNVLANTYVTVDGVTCAGIGAGVSLYDILKTVSDHMDQYSDSAAALQAFMTHWRSNGLTGEPWDSLNFA